MARPIKTNADYFTHDSDMRNDLKIKALRNKYGLEGYAIWCMVLEVLTDQSEFKYEWDEISIELMAADFGIETSKLSEVIEYCIKLHLFELEENVIVCETLVKRFENLVSKRKRDRNRVIGSDNTAKTTEKEVIASENTQSIVEYSIVEESRVNNTPLPSTASESVKPVIFFDSIKEKLLSEEIWKEEVCRQSGLGTSYYARLPDDIDKFLSWIIATGEESTVLTLSDAKRRFTYWYKYHGKDGNNTEKKGKGTNSRKPVDIPTVSF